MFTKTDKRGNIRLQDLSIKTGAFIAISAAPISAQTGWVNTNGNYYYYDSNGNMLKGWAQINDEWYYFGPNYGSMQTGLITIDNQLYYFNSNCHFIPINFILVAGNIDSS